MIACFSRPKCSRWLAGLSLSAALSLTGFAGTATVAIDFDKVETVLSPLTFSVCASGYGADGTQLPRQPQQQAQLAKLKIAMMRINLGYRKAGDPTSGLVCLAGGADASISGEDWLAAIRASGAVPAVRLQMNPADSVETWAADAANIVRQLNATPATRIERWVIGNEPDHAKHGIGLDAYTQGFIAMFKAMKAVDPTIAIGGPATASYNSAEDGMLKTFLRRVHAEGLTPDFVDFHSYGTGTNPITDADLLAITKKKYADEPADLRRYLIGLWGQDVGGKMQIELGEWNLSWRSDPRQLQPFASVWAALALSHMVKSGMIERFYADKNGALGLVCEVANPTAKGATYSGAVNDPQPAYHGIGMFTGESLFRGFGREVVSVTTTSSTGLLHVVASDEPRNIVAINSSPDDVAHVEFTLAGVGEAEISVWQKSPDNRDVIQLEKIRASGGRFSTELKPYTVTTFLVNAAAVKKSP
ncbi:hypothetical protein [Oleiharenicola lentus]|uniref:hypothetical protein n=1 Tax=Oleiharenicola lentus TaxID=2508720 RepID=UPI003F674A57